MPLNKQSKNKYYPEIVYKNTKFYLHKYFDDLTHTLHCQYWFETKYGTMITAEFSISPDDLDSAKHIRELKIKALEALYRCYNTYIGEGRIAIMEE